MFSLNPSAGPRVSLTHCFSSSRETVALHPAPVRRSAAATPAPPLRCRTRAAPAPLRRRATDLAPVHRLSRAPEPRSRRPAPRLRRLCTADHAPPPSKSSAAACRASTPSPRAVHLHPPLNLLTRREPSSPCPSHLVLICTQGVRQFVSKTTCVVFVGFSSFDLSGYDLNLLDMCRVSVSPQLHTCSHISLIVHKSHSCSNTSRSLLVCSFRGYPLEFMF